MLRANRARAGPPLGMVQNTSRTSTVVSINAFIYVCILFWKTMRIRSLIVILLPICGLLKQILTHNRSKFVLSNLVLTGVCCKHCIYMYALFVYTFLCARGVYVFCHQTSIYRPKFRQYSTKIWMLNFLISQKFG